MYLLHWIWFNRLAAKANAADSAIKTEDDSCMRALIKILVGGFSSVFIMKTPRPACLVPEVLLSGNVAASV